MDKAFSSLHDALMQPLEKTSDAMITALTLQLGPVITALATLYIMWLGLRVMWGQSDQPAREISMLAIKLGVISVLCLNADMYRYWVFDVFNVALANGISNAVAGVGGAAGGAASAEKFDVLAVDTGKYLMSVFKGGGSWSPVQIALGVLLGFVVLLVTIPVFVVMFSVFLWAKAGMLFVLGLGPIFLCFAMFETTKKFTHSFLEQAFSFVVQQVLATAVLMVMIRTIQPLVSKPVVWDTAASQVLGFCFVCAFCGATIALIPGLAAKLSGGFGAAYAHRSPRSAAIQTLAVAGHVAQGVRQFSAMAVGHRGSDFAPGAAGGLPSTGEPSRPPPGGPTGGPGSSGARTSGSDASRNGRSGDAEPPSNQRIVDAAPGRPSSTYGNDAAATGEAGAPGPARPTGNAPTSPVVSSGSHAALFTAAAAMAGTASASAIDTVVQDAQASRAGEPTTLGETETHRPTVHHLSGLADALSAAPAARDTTPEITVDHARDGRAETVTTPTTEGGATSLIEPIIIRGQT